MMVGYVGVAGGVTPVTCFTLDDGRLCGCGRWCDSCECFTLNDGRICGCGSCDMFYSQ